MKFLELNRGNLENILNSVRSFDEETSDIDRKVVDIIEQVKKKGNAALIEYTKEFDGRLLSPELLKISSDEISRAYDKVSDKDIEALQTLERNIRRVEEGTLRNLQRKFTINGIVIRQETRPLSSVGCYVPGGRASYPSTLLMTVVPARVAGVKRIVIMTPPEKLTSLSLVAADIAGVSEIYRVGGSQAIAALAYGTESIKCVDKIVGPGNIYVTRAKTIVSRDIEVDMPAGPTEIVIFADKNSDAKALALDLISQAEHGPDSICGLLTLSKSLAREVSKKISELSDSVKRKDIISSALNNRGFIIVADKIGTVIDFVNKFAPEHFEVISNRFDKIVDGIDNAGVIVVNSPSVLTDYYSGVNHVLPTNRYARFRGGLTVLDYVKIIRIVIATDYGCAKSFPTIRTFAVAEGLPNHMKAMEYVVNNIED